MGLNLEDQLVFYRSYHCNTVNVLIHSVFVPLILFASFGLASNVWITKDINLGMVGSLGYSIFYIYLDLVGGLIASALLLGITTQVLVPLVSTDSSVNSTLIILFTIGWIIQFIGHGVFEKNAPALFDNLVQALVLAPFFILFELFFLLGFHQDLKQRIDEKVSIILAKRREEAKT